METLGEEEEPPRLQAGEVSVTYIKSPIVPDSGTNYTLQIDFTSPDAIVAVQVLNPPSGLDQNTLDIILLNLLKTTLGQHTYDIATVNVGAAQKDYPYAIPSLFEYAVQTNSTNPNASIFGIQMLTVNKMPGNQDIIPGTIPTGMPTCDSVVLLSNQLFVQKLVLPGVASALNIPSSQLTAMYAGGSWMVVNTGDITLNVSHSPVLTSFNATVNNNLLSLHIIGNVVASPGITIDFTIDAAYQLQIMTNGTTQTIQLVQISQNVNHSVTLAVWVIIVASVLAALVALILGPVAGGLIAGIEALIIYIITTVANNEAGQIIESSLPIKVASNVTWSNLEYFTLKQALMPTPLQLGGVIPVLEAAPEAQKAESIYD